MSDLREQVANEIAAYYADTNARRTMGCADAALAVAEPIIRARVIAELAQRADADELHLDTDQCYNLDDGSEMVSTYLADWLRAQE